LTRRDAISGLTRTAFGRVGAAMVATTGGLGMTITMTTMTMSFGTGVD
jgi:hypothetical protein